MIQKGLVLSDLFSSKVFNLIFDFEEWPSTHTNDGNYIRPFNGSIFRLREYYTTVFPEEEFAQINSEDQDHSSVDLSKIYKIKYSVNLLPIVGQYIIDQDFETGEKLKQVKMNDHINLMGLFEETDELGIYDTDVIQQMIQYKWDSCAYGHHIKGCFFHFYHILTLTIYIQITYITPGQNDNPPIFQVLIASGLIYPIFYEVKQFNRIGFKSYFFQFSNYIDISYIVAALWNLKSQTTHGPLVLQSKVLMIYILLVQLVKTFLFLRIFSAFSPIVNMLKNVVWDLRIFLTFYAILVLIFSLLIGVLGVGNENKPGQYRTKWLAAQAAFAESGNVDDKEYSGVEYDKIGKFCGNVMVTLRMSMGDFGFDNATLLEQSENQIYWIVWFLIVIVTCIIFLNFIIAEASASYEKVSEQLNPTILSEKASLICEADEMTLNVFKNSSNFPKYIVVRDIEE